jgi:8-oxo-dGTP diphosphatase
MRFLTATNDFMDEDRKHYVTIFMGCSLPIPTEEESGASIEPKIGFEPRNMEPEKCEGWKWVQWEGLAAWGQEDSPINNVSDAANNATGKVKRGERERRRLSVPLLNLLKQRPGLHPLRSYLGAGTGHRARTDADQ